MRKLDESERLIVKSLIKNPRMSDNQIAKQTGVAVMTVNRKRKKLEEEGILQYFANLRRGENGLGLFEVSQLYIIKFRAGLTKSAYVSGLEQQTKARVFNAKFVNMSFLGEKDGHLALILLLEAPTKTKLTDEFNGYIIPFIRSCFGEHAIEEVQAIHINDIIRMHHNYIPDTNMTGGRIDDTWPEEYIFVDDVSYTDTNTTLDSFPQKNNEKK